VIPTMHNAKRHEYQHLADSKRSIGGCLIDWTSKKQPIISLSLREAELITCMERAQIARFMQQLMEEIICYQPTDAIF
jgi:hypothetical protein